MTLTGTLTQPFGHHTIHFSLTLAILCIQYM